MVSDTKKKRFRQGPESEQYDKFKDRLVRISGLIGKSRVGRLVWVDVYTLGIQFNNRDEVSIIYKGPGVVIEVIEEVEEVVPRTPTPPELL